MNRLLGCTLRYLARPSQSTLNQYIRRRPLCSSLVDKTRDIDENSDDVSFGVLDRKFLDSKSMRQLAERTGTESRSFDEEDGKHFHSKREESIRETRMKSTERDDEETTTFGTMLSEAEYDQKDAQLADEDSGAEDEDDHHIRLSKYNRKHSQPWYDHRLIKLSKSGKVLEAVRLLKDVMIDKDRVMPTRVSYTVVISALAKAGYTKVAFDLFYEMRQRGIKAPKHVFSALFNACANCPDKSKGLHQAHYLRDYMERNNSPRHYINYKAQIKAFAWTGDLRSAFATLDEAISDGNTLDLEACSMILMACVSDRENGFLHAIKVWRVMLEHGLRPEIHQYNLLTRCVQECGVHDVQQLQQLLKTNTNSTPRLKLGKRKMAKNRSTELNQRIDNREISERKSLGSGDSFVSDTNNIVLDKDGPSSSVQIREVSNPNSAFTAIPDVLSTKPRIDNLLGIESVEKASERLALLGGVSGLLSRMRRDNVRADIKTFTMLMECMVSETTNEVQLLSDMERWGVEPDTPFCNLVMRKRVFRQDLLAAKAVLELMGSYQLSPDLHTFATLALMCSTRKEADQLLRDMETQDIALTTEIFSHLNQAAYMNFNYRQWLCEQMEERQIQPDELFIRQCEKKIRDARKMINDWDRQDRRSERERHFHSKFLRFLAFYEPWVGRTKLKQHPKEPRSLAELKISSNSERLEFASGVEG